LNLNFELSPGQIVCRRLNTTATAIDITITSITYNTTTAIITI
jgi:hypothetical protein